MRAHERKRKTHCPRYLIQATQSVSYHPAAEILCQKPLSTNALSFSFSLIADAATIVPSIDFSYGLLPYPKWDENQAEYATMLQRNCYVMMPSTVEDTDSAGAVLEALASESYTRARP